MHSINGKYVLIAVGVGLAMTFADIVGVSVALPTIGRELHASLTELHWIINATLLGMAILVLAAGRLGDFWGHQKMFITGVVAFTIASVISAMANSVLLLILMGLLRGFAGVCITTLSSNVVMLSFPKEKQGAMVGIAMGIASLFTVIGPVVGGTLIQVASWRFIFWLNVPLAIISMAFLRFAHVPKQIVAVKNSRWDYQGFILSTITLASLAFAIMNFKINLLTVILLLIAIVAAILLWKIEHKVAVPMIDFKILKKLFLRWGVVFYFYSKRFSLFRYYGLFIYNITLALQHFKLV